MILSGNENSSKTPARERLERLFDNGAFTEIDAYAKSEDGSVEVLAGFGTVDGGPVYAFSQDVTVAGGAVSIAQGAKLKKLYELAAKTGTPVVGIYDSNGVRLKEDVDALAAFGEMLKWSNNLSGVVPQISVIAGSCIGTAALVAVSADFVIMAKDAQLYLSEAENTVNDAVKAGIVSMVAEDDMAAIDSAKQLIARLPINNISLSPLMEEGGVAVDAAALDALTEIDAKTIVDSVFDAGSTIELSKGFGSKVYTALSAVDGTTVGVIVYGQELCPNCAAKAARLIRFCDAFAIPVISFVNTEKLGQGSASLRYSALLSNAYAEATTQKISVIAGKAYGSAYIALAGRGANADMVYAWQNAEVSALHPEAAVSILWNDRLAAGESRTALVAEYAKEVASPMVAAAKGYIDDVISPSETRIRLIAALDMLSGKRETTLPKKHANFPL